MAELVETGMEPEFVITDIVRSEPVGSYMRLYLACQKHGRTVVQFTVLASADDFTKMAKQVVTLAASQANGLSWGDLMDEAPAH